MYTTEKRVVIELQTNEMKCDVASYCVLPQIVQRWLVTAVNAMIAISAIKVDGPKWNSILIEVRLFLFLYYFGNDLYSSGSGLFHRI